MNHYKKLALHELELVCEQVQKTELEPDNFPMECGGKTFNSKQEMISKWQGIIARVRKVNEKTLEQARSASKSLSFYSDNFYFEEAFANKLKVKKLILDGVIEIDDLEHMRINYAQKQISLAYDILERINDEDLVYRIKGSRFRQLLNLLRIKVLGLYSPTFTRKGIFRGHGENILVEYRALGLRARERQGRITPKGIEYIENILSR